MRFTPRLFHLRKFQWRKRLNGSKNRKLAHCGRVANILIRELSYHWFRIWSVNCEASHHYLNRRSHISICTYRNALEWIFDQYAMAFIKENRWKCHLSYVVVKELNGHYLSAVVKWYAENSVNLNASLITNNELRYRCCFHISSGKMMRTYAIRGKQNGSHGDRVPSVQRFLQWKASKKIRPALALNKMVSP